MELKDRTGIGESLLIKAVCASCSLDTIWFCLLNFYLVIFDRSLAWIPLCC